MGAVAILLAAGESERVSGPKPLLPWGDSTLIEYQMRQLTDAPLDRLIVVLGHAWERIEPLVGGERVEVLVNERYREGRASSVRAGAAAVWDDDEAVLILAVDQPRPAALLSRLLEAHRTAEGLITVPTFAGRRGHPATYSGALTPELRQVTEESQGLRALAHAHAQALREVPVEDAVVLVDINTPDEYRRAHELFFGAPPP